MTILNDPFNRYMGTDAPLERFREVANVIAGNLLHPAGAFHFLPPGVEGQVPWKDYDPSGKRYYGFHISKKHWVTGTDIKECGNNDKNYFIQLQFKWLDGDNNIRWLIYYTTFPWRSAKQENLPDFFIRYQRAFTTELHRRLLRLRPSWRHTNYKWQKAICTIPADSTISEVKEWFEEQSRIGERIIDETIERVLV